MKARLHNRGYNFGAGPAALPEEILIEIQAEMLNWQDQGMSILEISHRCVAVNVLMDSLEQLLRELLAIPNDYSVLFMGMPARMHFGLIPLNFLDNLQTAGYLITGHWSKMAFEEALKLKSAYSIASNQESNINIPDMNSWNIKKNSAYLYYTSNETLSGVRIANFPDFDIPLVADMTSSLLTEPFDVKRYDLIFAGVQKNIANAGLSIAIVSQKFLSTTKTNNLASLQKYASFARSKSLCATFPVFNCYVAEKMLRWVKKHGGIQAFYNLNKQKSSLLYDYIDSSKFYYLKVAKEARSLVNVCFYIKNSNLEAKFIAEAAEQGLLALKGHAAIGGLRASLYNAMPLEGAKKLVAFMRAFANKNHGS